MPYKVKEKYKDAKGVAIRHTSKDRQYKDQKKNDQWKKQTNKDR